MRGLLVTLQLTFFSLAFGLIIALPLSYGQVYGSKFIKALIFIYEKILRSIPEIVILFLIFYGFPRIGIRFSPFVACILGLGLRTSAYQSQIFRGAILSVKPNQMHAARSLGMTRGKAFLNVIFPQAFRIALPAWANEFTIVLKDSSLAYALGVTEMLREGSYVISTTYEPLLIYLFVALIYFVITITINKSLGKIEKSLIDKGFKMEENIAWVIIFLK